MVQDGSRALDQQAYSRWQAMEAVMTPMDKVQDYMKYVIRSYLYTRSRLFVPGRCYEFNSPGPIAAGGNAHVELIDLDAWLEKQSKEDQDTIVDWMNDASQESVAYWRGLRGHSGIQRRRKKVIENSASTHKKMAPLVDNIET